MPRLSYTNEETNSSKPREFSYHLSPLLETYQPPRGSGQDLIHVYDRTIHILLQKETPNILPEILWRVRLEESIL